MTNSPSSSNTTAKSSSGSSTTKGRSHSANAARRAMDCRMRLEARLFSTATLNNSSCVVWNKGNLFSRGPNSLRGDDGGDLADARDIPFEVGESIGSSSLLGETGGEISILRSSVIPCWCSVENISFFMLAAQ
jgi:hypothetical protein